MHGLNTASAFAPGGVGNIGVGFDLLGHSIEGVRDVVLVRRIEEPTVRILVIGGKGTGADTLPLDAERNTAGQALVALREGLGVAHGFELELEKGIPLGSGLGGSAASCVAALVAANALLDAPLAREALYPFALDGESVSSGSRQGDNVAPMLLGGVGLATAGVRFTRVLAGADVHRREAHHRPAVGEDAVAEAGAGANDEGAGVAGGAVVERVLLDAAHLLGVDEFPGIELGAHGLILSAGAVAVAGRISVSAGRTS